MRRSSAFTLVELLIVVTVIAILAAIAIPKFITARQQAFEASTKEQLKLLRDALANFNSDTQMWPINLDDMTGQTAPATVWNNGQNVKSLDASTYHGPYISYPTVPSSLSGWVEYDWVGGSSKVIIRCPQPGNALDGTPYSNW